MAYLKCRTIKDCINLNDYIFPENCRDSDSESIMESEDEESESEESTDRSIM